MVKKKSIIVGLCLTATLFFISIYGCKERTKDIKNWDGKLIVSLGTYRIERLNYIIQISIDKDKILIYSVKNEKDKTVIESTERPSIFHKWGLFWDKNDWLWFESSDIGGFVWKKDSNSKYKQYPVVDDPVLYKEMPEEIFNILPSSIKRKWKKVRGSI